VPKLVFVLVTGANGLLGASVAAHLKRLGHETLLLSRRRTSADIQEYDLAREDASLTRDVQRRPDVIVHLAAAVPHALRPDDDQSAAATRRMDLVVEQAALHWKAPVVYASGCSLYDRLDPCFKSETAPVSAETPYLRAKLDGERRFSQISGGCVMRVSSMVGPGLRRAVVLARFIEEARVARTLEVWGNGLREQDFVATSDVAEFVAAVVHRRLSGTFNVASGQPRTMLELATMVVEVVGSGSVRVGGRPDPQEKHTARFSIAAARREAGWGPRVPLSAAIRAIVGTAFAD
jgi:nucleoside-diphosphate-sugar epimerase